MTNEGVLNQISVAMEDTYGVAVTPTFSIPVLPSDGVVTEQEAVGVEAIDTTPALNKGFVRGVRKYPGTFEMNAYPEAMGFFFLSALGEVDSDTAYGETAVYTHVFTENVSKPSMTLEQVIGGIEERYAGYIAGGFDLTFAVGESLKLSSPGMAKTVADTNKITPAYEDGQPFKWDQISSLTVDGIELASYISEGNVEYVNGLEVFHGFSAQNEPTTSYVQNSEVTGSLNMFLSDTAIDILEKFRDQQEMAIVLTVTGVDIGNGENAGLVVSLPMCVVNAYSTQLATDYNKVTLDFVAGKHPTNGLITVTLTNEKASY